MKIRRRSPHRIIFTKYSDLAQEALIGIGLLAIILWLMLKR